MEFLRGPLFCLHTGNEVVLEHLGDDRVPSLENPLRMISGGIVVAGALQERDQRGGLAEREPGGHLAEVDLGGRGDPVRTMSEIDDVQIELEYLILRERPLEFHRGEELPDFARDRVEHVPVVATEVEVPRELLGDRAGPFLQAQSEHVFYHRLAEPDKVDPPVAVEIFVLGGDQGVDHCGGDFGEGEMSPVFYEELAQDLAVRRNDPRGELGPRILYARQGRETREEKNEVGAGEEKKEEDRGRDDLHPA